MMFLQFFVLGATVPIFSLYLTGYLNFSGLQAGTILSMSAVAAFISPLAGAFIADRLIDTSRLYGFCHVAAGILMGALSFQQQFHLFLILYLLYMLVFGPTNALSNAIAFHHLPDSERSFGGVRMWGTVGWIAVAWSFGFLWLRSGDASATRLPDALILSAFSSVALGLYAFTLPRSPAHASRRRQDPHHLTDENGFDAGTRHVVLKRSITRIFPVESFRVMMHRNVLFLSFISFLVSFVNRFYYFGTGPFLRQIGFEESSIMPAMSLGQVPEVFAMVLLGFFIKRMGIKRVIAMGILMELLRFLSFAVGEPTMIVFAGISFHGIAFAFFFTSASIYLDSHCSRTSRSGTHQLFTIITSGFGSLCGSLAAGKTLDWFVLASTGGVNFRGFWMVPAGISLFAMIIVLLLFDDKKNNEKNGI